MKLYAPANYDESILSELAANSVREIYGKLPFDVVGGGRPSYMATALSKKRWERYVAACRSHGIEFNYLLNSACYGNREWTKSFQVKVRKLLDGIVSAGATGVTISTPYLTQLVKKHYPQLRVKVGIYAQVDTVKRARYWEDLGADAINLESFSINRDFEKLAKIREAVKCDLPLIANHFCQPNCAYQIQHQNGHAHASTERSSFYVDFPIIQCQSARLSNPTLLISSQWIRPEDVARYEAIGYTSFKLLERNIPSEELVKRARAYHRRRWDGNLAELLFSWGFEKPAPGFSWVHFLKTFRPWKTSIAFSKSAFEFLKRQGMMMPRAAGTPAPIVIDNAKIPASFLDAFQNRSCNDRSCDDCGYCRKIAEQSVSVDPQFLESILPLYRSVQEQLIDGRFVGLSPRA